MEGKDCDCTHLAYAGNEVIIVITHVCVDEDDMGDIDWHAVALADELDPDDVGLYDEDDEADSYDDDDLDDLEDTDDEEDWQHDEAGAAADRYHGNVESFRVRQSGSMMFRG